MRLGLFGGSFDPVHYGHLLLAEYCRTECRLDTILFLPAAVAPHKQLQNTTNAEYRIAMLELAIAGHPSFEVSTLEIARGGVSFTVDTLRALKQQEPHRELFLLMGADALNDLPNWKDPDEICKLATLIVVRRGGSAEPDFDCLAGIATPERIAEFVRHRVHMPLIEISSTDIRNRVAADRSIRFQTPRAVEKYIQANRLYQEENGGTKGPS